MEFSEMLFYGGIAAIAASLVSGVAAFVIFKVRSSRLNRLLDSEYGERSGKTRKN